MPDNSIEIRVRLSPIEPPLIQIALPEEQDEGVFSLDIPHAKRFALDLLRIATRTEHDYAMIEGLMKGGMSTYDLIQFIHGRLREFDEQTEDLLAQGSIDVRVHDKNNPEATLYSREGKA